jgi:hypothetical protein
MNALSPGNIFIMCGISRRTSSGTRANMRKGRTPDIRNIWVPPTAL